MRGTFEVGQLRTEKVVEAHAGGYRGRVSVAGHGTRFTEVWPTEGAAHSEVEKLADSFAPGVFI